MSEELPTRDTDGNTPVDVGHVRTAEERRTRTWLIALTIAVAIQLLAGCLIAGVGISYFGMFSPFGAWPAEDAMMATDSVAVEIGYLVDARDVDGYMDLYPSDDPSVDLAAVRDDFEQVLASVDTSETAVEYMVDAAVLYEDEQSGEQLARMTLSSYDWDTGRPAGRRLIVWVLYDEMPDIVLTGDEGRTLSKGETLW